MHSLINAVLKRIALWCTNYAEVLIKGFLEINKLQVSYLFHISSCPPNLIKILWCEVRSVFPFDGVELNGETLEKLYVLQ